MSGQQFYERPDGTVYIGFFDRGLIGLDHNLYKLWKKDLILELEDQINSRLQVLWKTDKDLLVSLVDQKELKKIYDLFGIKEMDNGWLMDRWSEQQRRREQDGKIDTNLLKFEHHIQQHKNQQLEDQKWKLLKLKYQVDPSAGTFRVKRLHQQARQKLRRSWSSSEIGSTEKTDEYPFFLEKWGLGQPVQVETPEFLKFKESRRVIRKDRKKRNGF